MRALTALPVLVGVGFGLAAAVGGGAGCQAPLKTPCNDGLDNDGDGQVDRADVGCELSNGTSEVPAPADPGGDQTVPPDAPSATPDAGPGGPVNNGEPAACSDGLDNDGDGSADFPADPGCESADDTSEVDDLSRSCGPLVPVFDLGPDGVGTGEIEGELPNQLTSPTCAGLGGEHAFRYTVASGPVTLVVSTDHPETTLDTVLYVRVACEAPDTELACDDDGGDAAFGKASTLVIGNAPAGDYVIVVDSFGPGSLGTFRVTIGEL